MEAHSHFGKVGGSRSGQGFATRRGSVLVALISAVMAGVLIYLFVSHYHKTTVAPPATMTVYEAARYIPAGTPESTIAAENLLKPVTVPVASAFAGAISDPAAITGEVSAVPITLGQQVTVTDFSHSNVTISSYLTGDHRAVAIAIDSAHGLTSYLSRGDTIDVIAQGPGGTDELFQDVTVLGNQAGNVVLDLTDKQAMQLSNAVGNHLTIWFELRPLNGAKNSVPANYLMKL